MVEVNDITLLSLKPIIMIRARHFAAHGFGREDLHHTFFISTGKITPDQDTTLKPELMCKFTPLDQFDMYDLGSQTKTVDGSAGLIRCFYTDIGDCLQNLLYDMKASSMLLALGRSVLREAGRIGQNTTVSMNGLFSLLVTIDTIQFEISYSYAKPTGSFIVTFPSQNIPHQIATLGPFIADALNDGAPIHRRRLNGHHAGKRTPGQHKAARVL